MKKKSTDDAIGTVPSFLTSWGTLVILRSSISSCHKLESWPSSFGSSRIATLLLEGTEETTRTSCFEWETLNQHERTRLTVKVLEERRTGSEVPLAGLESSQLFLPNSSISLAGESNSCKQLEHRELKPSTGSHGQESHGWPTHKDSPWLQHEIYHLHIDHTVCVFFYTRLNCMSNYFNTVRGADLKLTF